MGKKLSQWLQYLRGMGLGKCLRDMCRTGLRKWLSYMRTCTPPVKVETYGAVTIYDYCTYKEAVIDGNSDLPFYIPHDIAVDRVVFNRSFAAGITATIFLPFYIPASRVHGTDFYQIAVVDMDARKFYFGPVVQQIEAYAPYIIRPTDTSLTFDGPIVLKKTVEKEARVGESNWYMRSVYKKMVFGDYPELLGRAYGVAAKDFGEHATYGKFVVAGPKAHILPMRVYVFDGNYQQE